MGMLLHRHYEDAPTEKPPVKPQEAKKPEPAAEKRVGRPAKKK